MVVAAQAAAQVVKTLRTSAVVYRSVVPTLSWAPADVCSHLMQEGFFGRPGGGMMDVGDFKCVLLNVELQPAHGTLARQPDGSTIYTPAKGFTGKDRIIYIVDAEGRKVRIVQDVTVEDAEPKEIENESESDKETGQVQGVSGSLAWLAAVSPQGRTP